LKECTLWPKAENINGGDQQLAAELVRNRNMLCRFVEHMGSIVTHVKKEGQPPQRRKLSPRSTNVIERPQTLLSSLPVSWIDNANRLLSEGRELLESNFVEQKIGEVSNIKIVDDSAPCVENSEFTHYRSSIYSESSKHCKKKRRVSFADDDDLCRVQLYDQVT